MVTLGSHRIEVLSKSISNLSRSKSKIIPYRLLTDQPCYKPSMSEILWAPWRLAYVEKPSTGRIDSKNIFVDLPAENEDEKNLIVMRGENAFMMLNAFPYASGHLLIAPYRKVEDIEQMSDPELLETQRLIATGVRLIRAAFRPEGFNIGVNMGRSAGAGIPQHLHWHVVPRWAGDGNFMSAIANTRVIPVSLEESYRRLKEARENLGLG